MAKTRKRTEVTVETQTHVVWRRGAGALSTWCNGCGTESLMLTPHEAALFAGVTTRDIYERVESGALHSKELPDGTLLVCAPSLGLNQF
jgi:hypothetical protein